MPVIKELTDLVATHVSYVRKGANRKEFFLMKSDENGSNGETFQRDFDLFVNKADEDKKLVYGVVYEPNAVDTQNEFAKAETIEAAAHQFLADCRNVDLQHNFLPGSGTVVESYVAPADFTIGTEKVKKGAWVLVTKAGDEVWESIKKGEITGYSMAGKATRISVTKEAPDESDNEVRGFINAMKSFFSGKVEKVGEVEVKSFSQRMAVNDVTENLWRVNDTLRAAMNDILDSAEITDKKTALDKAIDEYAAYMKKRVAVIDDSNVAKSKRFFEEPVSKSGRVLSGANQQKIKGAYAALAELLALVENHEESEAEPMKKEEMQEIMKSAIQEALAPVNEKLALLEKQERKPGAEETQETELASVVKGAMTEALKPINERISALEQSRGLSKQVLEEPKPDEIKKQASIFAGLPI